VLLVERREREEKRERQMTEKVIINMRKKGVKIII